MSEALHFLIIDGYSQKSRDALEAAGMQMAWRLYADMLLQNLPNATYDVLLPSDKGTNNPSTNDLLKYAGILWTGCNLTIYDTENPSVRSQIELAKQVFEIGNPSFGSCWGVQMAAVAAGGEVKLNPKGREMGLARKVFLTKEAKNHPMYFGKPSVFEAYISHDDIVTKIPSGAILMASNYFAEVQALVVKHKNGEFWAVQYHPEYNLNEMASLIVAREERLTKGGFFKGKEDFSSYVENLKALHKDPTRKELRWQLSIDDDVLDPNVRQCEFINWINHLVKPSAGVSG
jgi:GMP synthase (glutamine-hydrolysing)